MEQGTDVQIALPQYYCHKRVWALQIAEVFGETLQFVKPRYADRAVGKAYIEKHQPKAGGYWVQYEDGYESYSPGDAFEAGYRQTTGMPFSAALEHALRGARIARSGWNGRGMYVELQVPDENSKMRRPYLFMCPVDGDLVPWIASQSDLLTDDWVLG